MLSVGDTPAENGPPRRAPHHPRGTRSGVRFTDWRRTGSDTYRVSVVWSRGHPFSPAPGGTHDPMLLVETLGQCAGVLSRTVYRAPADHLLSLTRVQYRVNPHALLRVSAETEVELHLHCSDLRFHRSRPVAMTLCAEAVRDGELLALATLEAEELPPRPYRAPSRASTGSVPLYGARPSAASGPGSAVGSLLVPTAEPHRWQFRVSPAHPYVAPQATHVPRMVLLEALRQAATAAAPLGRGQSLMTSLDASFTRLTALDEPCWIEADPEPDLPSLTVRAIQRGASCLAGVAETTAQRQTSRARAPAARR
ncbi:AfsA-related hotdog domain-containing protein [Streptomyces spiramenti]|uniref:A-factor biosynthesis hotdog domain-containing protein n=1 Tax=Streptomyces spiramenti TaxID=2720606 RepID=A0ABX1AUZ1_9ACTN|nr:AfsA-related hotdog domain-containing protein [Streptomyces spiramenti]NJP68222.1 hypothetical protein [Streptomyces spiramenti]